jgi:2-amino-4-hydroxy-6-hydroxymethyldihydropteridine diphosphokinase
MLKERMAYTAYIGLGSNLASPAGSPVETVQEAVRALARLGALVAESPLYRTAPVGYTAQPGFVNAAVCLETELEPEELLERLLAVEHGFGRDRKASVPKGPRTLDLDLLLVLDEDGNGIMYDSPTLTLPHPEMAERRFVLEPMAEIGPEVQHPVLGKTMRQLRDEFTGRDGDKNKEVTRL